MTDSILTTVKKLIGLAETDTSFDEDLLVHINTVLLVLTQLGVSVSSNFDLQDGSTSWDDLLGSDCDPEVFRAVKSYVTLKVRKVFDPPQNTTVMQAIDSAISELEWRLNVQVDPKEEHI